MCMFFYESVYAQRFINTAAYIQYINYNEFYMQCQAGSVYLYNFDANMF